jgi:hypothetical protein
MVGTEVGVKVTEDSDANGIAHRVIVLEQLPVIYGGLVRKLVRGRDL